MQTSPALKAQRDRKRYALYWWGVAKEHGVSYNTFRQRITKLGWNEAKAAMHPLVPPNGIRRK